MDSLVDTARPAVARSARTPAGRPDREIFYYLSYDELTDDDVPLIRVQVVSRSRKKDGSSSKLVSLTLALQDLHELPNADDRRILQVYFRTRKNYPYYSYQVERTAGSIVPQVWELPPLIEEVCRTGRALFLDDRRGSTTPMKLDEGEPWKFRIVVRGNGPWTPGGELFRGDEVVDVRAPRSVFGGSMILFEDTVSRLDARKHAKVIDFFRIRDQQKIPKDEGERLRESLLPLQMAGMEVVLPKALEWKESRIPPVPLLRLAGRKGGSGKKLGAELRFKYGDVEVASTDATRRIVIPPDTLLLRDQEAEATFLEPLTRLGLTASSRSGDPQWTFAASRLPELGRELLPQGWMIEAAEGSLRAPGQLRMKISSGVDWFDLEAEIDYGGESASLEKVLEAIRQRSPFVVLGSGELGMIPEEAFIHLSGLLAAGEAKGKSIRFRRNQVGLLDALLAARPANAVDSQFETARANLANLRKVNAQEPPSTFRGELRPYQRDALGWFEQLRILAFGGCLADDMGLGKTVQVLALLESRRLLRLEDPTVPPSLVVVPRSLVFNWKQEAARFTPDLRVLDHTLPQRSRGTDHFAQSDVVLTTYGTMQRDAAWFVDHRFDYLILDEAQAIKNASTNTAKAARLLQGDHRLALSGTPIENHLGELWSLFEFLNPGMLGKATIFERFIGARDLPDEARSLVARAVRPLILRRTKSQVATELPAKVEQTLYCELEGEQKVLYESMRQSYRDSLLRKVSSEGLGKSKIHVLEALLRLRQVACHPGLVTPEMKNQSSAKLSLLMEELRVIIGEGHKCLVFSQFTSLLALLRKDLDEQEIQYAYLDGKSRDRKAQVERFQSDPTLPLFLISLRAGGLGLNLTAADYVFILDPWWNPAVEAQAIDRTHRLGQQKQVFAYRIVAKDTVEEKILQLQQGKRALADAILGENEGLLRGLSAEDLDLLLS